MGSENRQDGQKKRSFIEEARRAQIIQATIETVAEHGYGKASLARIAERAGISKGVISYHFAGKDELFDQVVINVYMGIAENVGPRIEAAPGPREALREHVIGVGTYMFHHRVQLIALSEIFLMARTDQGKPKYGIKGNEPLYEAIEAYFKTGQEIGVLRHFDRRVMAVTMQAAIDNAFATWVAYPEYDLLAHFEELAEIIDRAIRADSAVG